jgi:hypothetical protein
MANALEGLRRLELAAYPPDVILQALGWGLRYTLDMLGPPR